MDVSIIITTFNYELYIEECINSCLNQLPSGLDYEVIVVDDGSTDDTPNILSRPYPDHLQSYRINNSGIEIASNFGFDKAKGKYIVRVDADDLLLPNYLQVVAKYLPVAHGFLYSNYNVIDGKTKYIREVKLPSFETTEIVARGDFLATGTLYDAQLIKSLHGYNINIVNSGLENYEFILDLLLAGVLGYRIPKVLFSYRRHAKNISELKRTEIINNGKNMFVKRNLGNFTTNKFHPYGLEVD